MIFLDILNFEILLIYTNLFFQFFQDLQTIKLCVKTNILVHIITRRKTLYPKVYINEDQLRKPCFLLIKTYWFLINPAIEYNDIFSSIAEVGFQSVVKEMGIPPIHINTADEATDFINFKIEEGVVGYDGNNFYSLPPSDEEIFWMSQNPVHVFDFFDPSIIDIKVALSPQCYFTIILCPRVKEAELIAKVSIFTSRYFLLWWFRPTRGLANYLLNRKVKSTTNFTKKVNKRKY
jgi:hypothetical protein